MKNKFSLSFGIALIVVGVLNLFLETNKYVIFGLSISSIVFSIIDLSVGEKNKYEFVYVLPFIIMITFLCYNNSLMKIEIIRNIVESNFSNVLVFLSFGILFVSNYINNIKKTLFEIQNLSSIIQVELNNNKLISNLIDEYLNNIEQKNIKIDKESAIFLKKINK